MKTPLLKDMDALRLCNPLALRLPAEQGGGPPLAREDCPVFTFNLMSIPIEPTRSLIFSIIQ
jgi:hypothetical protein